MFQEFLSPPQDYLFVEWRKKHKKGFWMVEDFSTELSPKIMRLHKASCNSVPLLTDISYINFVAEDNIALIIWAYFYNYKVELCQNCSNGDIIDTYRLQKSSCVNIYIEKDKQFTDKILYKKGLIAIENRLSMTQRAMLKSHAEAPNHSLSVLDLAHSAGSRKSQVTSALYGKVGRVLAEEIDPAAKQPYDPNKQRIWTYYLAGDFRLHHELPLCWTMHKALAQALFDLGWANSNPSFSEEQTSTTKASGAHSNRNTVREAVVKSRIGQGQFRDQLLTYWQGCAVTGIGLTEVLIASHIKPWAYANNQERLDPFNGLLLIATLDRLFDCGLISFDEYGVILISPQVAPEDCGKLSLTTTLQLRIIEDRHRPYLAYHRQNVYRTS